MEFLDRYKFDFKEDLLGYGGFGEVYRAYDTLLNREVALKFYKNNGSSKYDLITEIKKVIRLHHPNLLEFYDATILSQQNAFGQFEDLQVGVMEFANQGDLLAFMETKPTKEEIKIVFLGILSGLKFMHKNGFIHRDLKPQNILFVKKGKRIIPKIADFGISKNAIGDNSSNSTKLIGTVEYMAPEQFNPKFAIDGHLSYNLDLWSLGIMFFELLNGSPPFGKRSKTTHSEQIMHNICYEGMLDKLENIEEPFKSVLDKCLIKDANKRAKSAEELINLLSNYQETKPVVKSQPKKIPTSKPKSKTDKKETDRNVNGSMGKIKKVLAVGVFFVILGFGLMYLFKTNKSSTATNEDIGFRYFIDKADKTEDLNRLVYLDTALFYLDSSYHSYELYYDSANSPTILDEVLVEIKDKKLKTAATLSSEDREIRALDVLTIESEFDGSEKIKTIWIEEALKLNEKQ